MASHPAPTLPAPDTPDRPDSSTLAVARHATAGGARSATRSTASSRRKRPRRSQGIVTALSPALVGAAALLLWQFLTQSGAVNAYLVPMPAQVAQAFVGALRSGLFFKYGATTLAESLVGFALGVAIALPLGYGIARSRTLAAALEPYMAASQAVPAVALAPLLVLWLPIGLPPVAALCALIVFFPAAINTTLGFRTLDHEVVDAARLDGAGGWALLRSIEAPLALPTILAGLRASLTLSITGAVVGEFVVGDQGMGGLLSIARGNFDPALEFATLIALALMAIALYGVARFIEWYLVYLEV